MSDANQFRDRDPRIDARVETETAEGPGLRAAPNLIGEVLTHVSNLVRKEMDLARAEMSENLKRAVTAVGLLVGAVVLALVALNVLAAALVAALAELGLEAGWAALIVGGVLALIGLLMAMKGAKDLKASSLAPTRTAKNVQRDTNTVKESLQ